MFRTYCLDTSAMIFLDSSFKAGNNVFEAIWKDLDDLMSMGCLVTSTFVEDEINDYQGKETFLKEWLKKRKHIIKEMDAPSLVLARRVINDHQNTGFLNRKKWLKGKDEADPYLIGMAHTHNWVIITNEGDERLNRLPKVAESYGVESLSLYEFLEERGLRMVKTPKSTDP